MSNNINEDLIKKSEHLFKVIGSGPFLKMEALNGEVPFFISSFHPARQAEMDVLTGHLVKRLENAGITVNVIDLFDLSVSILKKRNKFDAILKQESRLAKDKLLKTMQSLIDVETQIIPEIEKTITEKQCAVNFLTGIGLVFPYLRSHTVLNNLQRVATKAPTVIFFPGIYTGTSLEIFGKLKDDNYYRAFNLDHFHIDQQS